LEVPYPFLTYILYWGKKNYPYRTFSIAKRSGALREIEAPANSVSILQSKLNQILQIVYRRRPAAHGFVTDRSIVTNALNHTGKAFVLNVDLKDFFPSIHFGRVRGMFIAPPYNLGDRAATFLAQLACHEGKLPQGAPTSPMISNMVCAKLDGDLQKLARKYRCTYSRYADDLTLSTTRREFPAQLAYPTSSWSGSGLAIGDELLHVITSNGFEVNDAKKRLLHRTRRQEVTGLTVNRFANVRRNYTRQIRAMLHAWDRHGLNAAQAEYWRSYCYPRPADGSGPPYERVVKGKLDYLKMVKGEADPTYRRLSNWLHRLDPNIVRELPELPVAPDDRWARYFHELRDSVYQLEIRDKGTVMSGTAFAWEKKTLATAAHNLRGQVFVYLPDRTEPVQLNRFAFHPGGDERIDVALVALPDAVEVQPAFTPFSGHVGTGELVAAIGYPTVPGHEPAVGIYPGRVESLAPFFGGDIDCIQVTIEMSGGLSGGPVIERGRKLIGVAIESSFERTATGVPAREFRHVLPVRYLREIQFDD
jgi:RNA-directed DNA polymerase